MKRFGVAAVLILACVLLPSLWRAAFGQSGGYTVVSKRCTACKREVDIKSRVGQRCPYRDCRVIWGRETTTRKNGPTTVRRKPSATMPGTRRRSPSAFASAHRSAPKPDTKKTQDSYESVAVRGWVDAVNNSGEQLQIWVNGTRATIPPGQIRQIGVSSNAYPSFVLRYQAKRGNNSAFATSGKRVTDRDKETWVFTRATEVGTGLRVQFRSPDDEINVSGAEEAAREAIERIRSSAPRPLPEPLTYAAAAAGVVTIENRTGRSLRVIFSGPGSKTLSIPSGAIAHLSTGELIISSSDPNPEDHPNIMLGDYEVAAETWEDTPVTFYGKQSYALGRAYRLRFDK